MDNPHSTTRIPFQQVKRCLLCLEIRPFSRFSPAKRGKNGRYARCRDCHNANCRASRRGEYKARKKPTVSKVCSKCNVEKPVSEFYYRRERDSVYSRCKECSIDDVKKWRKENPDRVKENKERYLSNPESKERELERSRVWRARKRDTEIGSVPSLLELVDRQGGKCANCKVKGKRVVWHLDHVIPLAKGGTHTADNVEALCSFCNVRKGAKMPDRWATENGRLL